MRNLVKSIASAGAALVVSAVSATASGETSVTWGLSAGSQPRTLCVYDTSHICVPAGLLDSSTHLLGYYSPNILGSGEPGLYDASGNKTLWLVRQEPSSNTSMGVAAFEVQRLLGYTGGTSNVVEAAIKTYGSASANVGSAYFVMLSVLDNSATAGDNVAGYFQGNKLSTGPTWALVAEAIDKTGLGDPASALIGAEIDIEANGTDASFNRIGIDIELKKHGSGSAPTAGAAIRIEGNDGQYTNVISFNGTYTYGLRLTGGSAGGSSVAIYDTGTHAFGIDLSGTYSVAALKVTSGVSIFGDKVVFGATNLTVSAGSFGMNKITASAAAPGAAGGKVELVCGTNAGTAKLVAYAGTSGTAATILDNIGAGVSGC